MGVIYMISLDRNLTLISLSNQANDSSSSIDLDPSLFFPCVLYHSHPRIEDLRIFDERDCLDRVLQ